MMSFEIYTGRKYSNDPEIGIGENVVNSPSLPFINADNCLYIDNFFIYVYCFLYISVYLYFCIL